MDQTILSQKQSEILDGLIAKYGQIVTFGQIMDRAGTELDRRHTQNLVTKLVRNGWLIRLKRELYAISDLSNRGFLSLSPYFVANLLVENSYVSFEAALQHYGMFDQSLAKISSVSLKSHKTIKLNNTEYGFIKSKPDYYFGWQDIPAENKTARIAFAEKALIDMINFHRTKYAVDLVLEKLREYKKDLDFKRFEEYLRKFPVTIAKIFGLLFDLEGIDSTNLFEFSRSKSKYGVHLMTTGDKKFNSKWRLYYDEYFDKYQKQ